MRVRAYVDDARVGALFQRSSQRLERAGRDAIRGAAQDVADEILRFGRADIRSAGNFGTRWTEGLEAGVTVTEGGGSVRINVTHAVPYWRVFEYGATIHGRPLLWIPLSFANIPPGINARDFGPLFRVDRKAGGAPLLLSIADKQPKYFGKESVTVPRKFHLRDIARRAANRLPLLWQARVKEEGLR
jgi:Bacteriophage HK97-gp10, putative tail-component